VKSLKKINGNSVSYSKMDNNIISLITNPPFAGSVFILKIGFIGISLIMTGLIVLFLSKTNWLKFRLTQNLIEFVTYKPFGAKKIAKQWMKIKQRLDAGLESEFKLAVIEADAMLDDILKKMGYNGESLGDKLKQVSADILPSLAEVQGAHEIRNNIVHDPDYRLNLDGAQKTISFYEKAFTDLDVL